VLAIGHGAVILTIPLLMKTSPAFSRPILLSILALAVLPYFIGLGASTLWDSNEAFYTEVPRQMILTGDWVNPSFNGKPRFNKPPLSYWVVAASYKIFGVSELAERLPIALGAVVLILIVFIIGRELHSVEAGLYGAIAMAASPRFLMFSRRIIIDLYLAMFMGLVLIFFVLAEKRPDRRKLFLALMYCATGLAVLTKGPVGAVLPAAVFLIHFAVTGRLRRLREIGLPSGLLIVAAIVLPWYVIIYHQHGWQYIESFLLRDNLSRYTQPVWGPRRGVFFYIPVLIGDLLPWSIFLPLALWTVIRGRFKPDSVATSAPPKKPAAGLPEIEPSLGLLMMIWVAVIVVVFSLSSNKEDLYILPAFPAATALVGAALARALSEPRETGSLRWALIVLAAVLVAAGGAVLSLFGGDNNPVQLAGTTAIGVFALAGGLLAAALAAFKKHLAALLTTAVVVIAANWVFTSSTLKDFERYKPVRRFCDIIGARADAEALVGYYRLASPSMVFYLGRPVFEYYDDEELLSAFSSGKQVYCLITAGDYEALAGKLPGATYVLASNPVFQVKLKVILEKKELPQVLLISNVSGAK
jgi:4-amino-4-deoxy-L-arabinose transferase-like glycosyltransferase